MFEWPWGAGLFGLCAGWLLHGVILEMERRKQERRKVWRAKTSVEHSLWRRLFLR